MAHKSTHETCRIAQIPHATNHWGNERHGKRPQDRPVAKEERKLEYNCIGKKTYFEIKLTINVRNEGEECDNVDGDVLQDTR